MSGKRWSTCRAKSLSKYDHRIEETAKSYGVTIRLFREGGTPLDIELNRLTEVDKLDIIELMNHPLLKRHMPLLGDEFTEADCDAFVSDKEKLWAEHGYGPWAFLVDGKFAGWGMRLE